MDFKKLLPVVCLWAAIIPWGSGGKEPWAILITSFALMLAGFFIWRAPDRRSGASLLMGIAMSGLAAWSVLSLTWTANRYQSELWLIYLGLGVLVFSLSSALDNTQKRLLAQGYIWIAAAVGLVGLIIYYTGDYNRLTSVFYWANPAAGYLLPAFFMALAQFARRRHWQWALVSTFLGTAFFLTDSRGAILVLSVGVVIAWTFSAHVRQNWKKYLLILVAAFVLSIGFTFMKGHTATAPGSRFAEAAIGESQSVRDRLHYLGSALKVWEDHPALGTGAGTYSTVHPRYQSGVTDAANNAHNLYLQVAAELGLIGFLLLLWVVVILTFGLWRGWRRRPENGVIALGIVLLLMHFGIEIDSNYPAIIALLFLLSGLVYQPMVSRRLYGTGLVAIPAVAALVVAGSISLFLSQSSGDKADAANDNHDYTSAASLYAKAHSGLVYNPDYWTAEGIDYYELAGITGGSKTYLALAKDRSNQAISRDRDDAQHYFLRARVERLAGDLSSATNDYRQALKLDRFNHPDYYLDLALTKLQEGDKDGAQAIAQQGLALYPDEIIAQRSADSTIKPAVAGLLVVTAYDQISHGQLQEAKRTLHRALRLNPSNTDAQTLLEQGQNIIIPVK